MFDAAVERVSAVLIGRNEGRRLERCLSSMTEQVRQLVYVDSGSTDGSALKASSMGADVVPLDMGRPFTASRARAQGFARLEAITSSVDYVMFIDGDCEIEQGWLSTATEFLDANPRYAVVCGRRRERFPSASRYNALADREWDTPVGEAASCGGDAMMRIEALKQVGGFDPTMIAGEEPELCHRLRASGWRIMRLDAPMTIHDAAMTRFGQWWLRAVRSGFGYAQAWDKTRKRDEGTPLYARELARALGWGAALPIASLGLALFVHPLCAGLWPAATAAQFARMWRREGRDVAALSIAGKFAELAGALRYVSRALRGSSGHTIDYK